LTATGDPQHLFLVGYSGELSIKARKTRLRFAKRLARNLAEALEATGIPFAIDRTWSRLFLRSPSPEAGGIAADIFGVQSVWPAEKRPWGSLDDILRAGEEIFAPRVAGKTFAVRARRGGEHDKIPFRSPEIERRLGAVLLPHAAGVDLTSPQVTVRLEVRAGDAYFLGPRLAGHAGLPLGTEGRAVALVSGGFDSLVASWLLLRRGVMLDHVFLNLGGDQHRDTVLAAIKVIADRWSFGYRPQLHLVDFSGAVEEIKARCPQGLWQVVLKRQMLRVAERVARQVQAAAVVTGEAVGQVSSQTLQNLTVISEATELPILRPLVAANKDEIMDLARKIGTYDLSARVPEYCAIAPRRPQTHASAQRVAEAETGLEPERLAAAVAERAVFDLRALDLARTRSPALAVDEIPDGAVVVDLRPAYAYRSWHYPGALHLDYVQALAAHPSFDRAETYVFYCEVGLKSAHLAELLHAAGGRAHHVEGGLRQVVRLAERQDEALTAAMSPALLSD
jgi:thiamine biosynthesis protein ThiI